MFSSTLPALSDVRTNLFKEALISRQVDPLDNTMSYTLIKTSFVDVTRHLISSLCCFLLYLRKNTFHLLEYGMER